MDSYKPQVLFISFLVNLDSLLRLLYSQYYLFIYLFINIQSTHRYSCDKMLLIELSNSK